MPQNRMYQISTLQALALGYSRAVVSAGELLEKGDCGLGTFTGVDGDFEMVDARSESPYHSHHVTLKEILGKNQRAFVFDDVRGSLVGVYFPDYMDGINMPGWHLHFLSEDRTLGGHVFDMRLRSGTARVDKICNMELELPREAAFDTYALKQDLQAEIKSVE